MLIIVYPPILKYTTKRLERITNKRFQYTYVGISSRGIY